MPRNYSRTRAWGCAANAGGWLPAQTDERSAHDEEYFSVEDHNSAIVLPRGTIYKLAGRHLTWEDDPISLKSVIEELPHELRKMNMIKHKG